MFSKVLGSMGVVTSCSLSASSRRLCVEVMMGGLICQWEHEAIAGAGCLIHVAV